MKAKSKNLRTGFLVFKKKNHMVRQKVGTEFLLFKNKQTIKTKQNKQTCQVKR